MSIEKSKIASPCETSGSFMSKSYGDMIEEGASILDGGYVTGVLKYVTGYKDAFSGPEADGYFFPVHLADEYKEKDIRVQRVSGHPGAEKTVKDTDWVLRVTDGPNTVYTFRADNEDGENEVFLTLNFSMASFVYSEEELREMEITSYSTKNYMSVDGTELVIGGKLTVLEGAEVEGLSGGGGGSSYTLPTATADTLGGVKPKAKTNESVEVTVDGEGKLWAPKYPTVPTAPSKATAAKEGLVKQAAKVDDAADAEGESLKTTLNALLASLRTAGILAQ